MLLLLCAGGRHRNEEEEKNIDKEELGRRGRRRITKMEKHQEGGDVRDLPTGWAGF